MSSGRDVETAAQPVLPLVNLGPMYAPLRDQLLEATREVLDSLAYVNGPAVGRLERLLAARIGVRQAVGVSSGTDALLAALMALGVGPGDEVITTPLTFFSTASCVTRLGATPVFVDVEPDTFLLDPAAVEAAITPRTRGIIPVHLFGQMCDMVALQKIAQRHALWLVEDAAQAIDAARDGLTAGAAGDLGCFSFFPTKNLGAVGDGGLVTSDDEALAQRIRVVGRHGAEPKYMHHLIGGNFRMDTLQAALLEVKVGALSGWTAARRANAAYYDEAFFNMPGVVTPRVAAGAHHVYHHYCVRVAQRDEVARRLSAMGIGTAVYYPLPLHLQTCFEDLGYRRGALPEAERACDEVLALPIWPGLTAQELECVMAAVRECIAK